MTFRKGLSAIVTGAALSVLLLAPTAGTAATHLSTRRARRGHRHHLSSRRAAAKAPVVTLSEYSKGKLHKLKAGSPYYGLAYSTILYLQTKEEVHGYKWTLERPIECPDSGLLGTIKSTGAATSEIELESGSLASNLCHELSTYHGNEELETYTRWPLDEVTTTFLPARLVLETRETYTHATLYPNGAFEIEVKANYGSGTTCRYFSLLHLSGSTSTHEPDEALPLKLTMSGAVTPEQFNSSCPEEGTLSFSLSSRVGENGGTMFIKDT